MNHLYTEQGFPGDTVVKNPHASAGHTKDAGSIPRLGRSPEVGNGSSFQYSCLENCVDRGAWGDNPWDLRVRHDLVKQHHTN